MHSDLETVEGFSLDDIVYDNPDDINNDSQSHQVPDSDRFSQSQISSPILPITAEEGIFPPAEAEEEISPSTDLFSPSDQSSQEIIDSHQNMIEDLLNLVPSDST